MEKKLELLNSLIDDRIEMYGIQNTISYLLDFGFSRYSIINEFLFDEDDVYAVIAERAIASYGNKETDELEECYNYEPDEPDDNIPHTLEDIRAHVLRSMDEEIRNYGDEETIMYWLEEGVPDHGLVELDYYKEFVDDDCYYAISECFDECLRMRGEEV